MRFANRNQAHFSTTWPERSQNLPVESSHDVVVLALPSLALPDLLPSLSPVSVLVVFPARPSQGVDQDSPFAPFQTHEVGSQAALCVGDRRRDLIPMKRMRMRG